MNTFSQIYIQIVFSVKNRNNSISNDWKNELYKYIAGIITAKKQKVIKINGTLDHIHIFVGLKPDIAISDLVRDIKNNSSKYINDKQLTKGKFYWQEGYGAFSYAHSQIDAVCKYINNKESHHKKKSFKEEYLEFLKKFNVQYDERYIFN